MRGCLWSSARGELCYGSQWICCWQSLRFFNEASFGMCLRACSQSLGLALWSLPPLLYLPFKMWPWSPLEDFERQTRMRAYTLGSSSGLPQEDQLSTESLIAVRGFSPRMFWEWLMPGVHSAETATGDSETLDASLLTVTIYYLCREWDIHIANVTMCCRKTCYHLLPLS